MTFSAYCFNVDQVKSETSYHEYTLPTPVIAAKGRAYMVTMGVNASQAPGFTLQYAVNDAEQLAQTVTEQITATGKYASVVSLPLTAPDTGETGDTAPETITASKDDLRVVLKRLAGQPLTTPEQVRLARISGADKLAPATPDDLVLVSFAGHGEAGQSAIPTENGRFYLLPYDLGSDFDLSHSDPAKRMASLSRCISSDDLSLWLRDVDAGELAFIVDACHSAAAVEGAGGFKPGPMGARGLGQLAYDKGMRVPAATQAVNVAQETKIKGEGNGLLTYALVKNGLQGHLADFEPVDQRITLGEWLRYGVNEVPELWRLVATGKARGMASQIAPPAPGTSSTQNDSVQRPSLFDFTAHRPGGGRDPLLMSVTASAGQTSLPPLPKPASKERKP